MNQYLTVYGNMRNRTVYYKERPLDDYHFYNGKLFDKVRIVQYPSYFEGGSKTTLSYDSFNHNKLIPATEQTDGISFKKDLVVDLKKNTIDGIFLDNFYNLIYCVKGYLFLNVTNMTPGTNNYLESESFILSPESSIQVLIPPFYGFSYKSLSDSIIIDKLAFKSEETFLQKKIDINQIKIEWP